MGRSDYAHCRFLRLFQNRAAVFDVERQAAVMGKNQAPLHLGILVAARFLHSGRNLHRLSGAETSELNNFYLREPGNSDKRLCRRIESGNSVRASAITGGETIFVKAHIFVERFFGRRKAAKSVGFYGGPRAFVSGCHQTRHRRARFRRQNRQIGGRFSRKIIAGRKPDLAGICGGRRNERFLLSISGRGKRRSLRHYRKAFPARHRRRRSDARRTYSARLAGGLPGGKISRTKRRKTRNNSRERRERSDYRHRHAFAGRDCSRRRLDENRNFRNRNRRNLSWL